MSYCSPRSSNEGRSCYRLSDLRRIGKIINENSLESPILLNQLKSNLWEAIRKRLSDSCKNEWCWVDHKIIRGSSDKEFLEGCFRPKHPKGSKKSWLSTSNIYSVMKQYEDYYKDFIFFGPVPINFKDIGMPLSRINLRSLLSVGMRSVGIIFNTDPHTRPGKHWMSMFIDLKKNEINYFDSSPRILVDEVKDLISSVSAQGKLLDLNFVVNINTIKHQYSDSECGVYSIYFITESLKGISYESIVNNIIKDDEMNKKRGIYFRPRE